MEALRVVGSPGSCKSEMRANARMAKSADAADLKSVGLQWLWEFKSPSGHHLRTISSASFYWL